MDSFCLPSFSIDFVIYCVSSTFHSKCCFILIVSCSYVPFFSNIKGVLEIGNQKGMVNLLRYFRCNK